MDWTSENAQADLTWFYLSAPGECGVRSIQSGFEAQMEARALGGKQDGGIHLHETRSHSTFDPIDDRRIDSYRRARTIHQRLALLTEHDRRVLEAQYSCSHRMGDVSLSLACSQDAARKGHIAALQAARLRHERAFAQSKAKATGGKCGPALPKSRRLNDGSTPRDYVLFLCLGEDTAALDVILDQARAELSKAMAAYIETARRAA